jgi:Mg2+/Co2+ transporter CorB
LNELSLPLLFALLFLCLTASGFFSGSETGLMTLNRYRLKHRAQKGETAPRWAHQLLERPDRLIGLILLLNNVAQALIPMLLLSIAQRLIPDPEIALLTATVATALMIFIFAESMPKTLGALHPERLALPAAVLYWPIMRIAGWLVDGANLIGNSLLRLFGVTADDAAKHSLSAEELRTVVAEAGAMIPQRHQKMLLSILDLEKETVEDIMVPRNEIVGIDLAEDWDTLRRHVLEIQHARVPLYHGSIDDLRGVVQMRDALRLAAAGSLEPGSLERLAREPYFVPEGTPLNQQLLNFQNQARRVGFVVDEYGDIQGLVALEDILEEVVGEFTTDPGKRIRNVQVEADGSYQISGSVTLLKLNRSFGWKLPTTGPKTLNGLVLEHLEQLPKPGKHLELNGYRIEILETRGNAIKAARIRPPKAAI